MIILEKFQNKKQLNVLTSRKLKFNVVINMIYYCKEKKKSHRSNKQHTNCEKIILYIFFFKIPHFVFIISKWGCT